jgi:outer membrane lipoprotein SlyB
VIRRMVAMSVIVVPMVSLVLLLGSHEAAARGCLKGAAVGAVAGHFAGHHGVVGAVAGCAVGHHLAKKKEQRQTGQPVPQPAAPASGAIPT